MAAVSDKDNEAPETISLKAVYEISIKARHFEISHLIQRNNFFMLFQGVLLASVMQAQNSRPFVELVVCKQVERKFCKLLQGYFLPHRPTSVAA